MPYLFSYGTLQQENVQIATFRRRLAGHADELPGFEQLLVKIDDLEVIATSGKTHHPIVKFPGNQGDRVPGTVFELAEAEIANADSYEVAAYKRVDASLASDLRAWVYVDAHHAPPGQ
jgi:gamma-glutamylcyclotransferase (GGCT)/AIG2-like uncharacterized protein YtfP